MERRDWSQHEIECVVAAYFRMLEKQICSERFSKATQNERLRAQLDRRTRGSVDFKLANVSAVLAKKDLPCLRGYRPRPHYQRALEKAVDAFLVDHPLVRRHLEEAGNRAAAARA